VYVVTEAVGLRPKNFTLFFKYNL